MVRMAGTRKSTISQTICENLDKKNMLSASFFCSRASNNTSNACLISPSIAHELARTSSSITSEVVKAIQIDEKLTESTCSLKEQFMKLIYNPIQKSIDKGVIVIDGVRTYNF
jgi:hypothetical protein